MDEHSVQVVISGPGERQVSLSWRGNAPGHGLVLQVASASALRPALLGASPQGAGAYASSAPLLVSLELRSGGLRPEPLPPPSPPAPLATAWATAQRLWRRHPASFGGRAPRPRMIRSLEGAGQQRPAALETQRAGTER